MTFFSLAKFKRRPWALVLLVLVIFLASISPSDSESESGTEGIGEDQYENPDGEDEDFFQDESKMTCSKQKMLEKAACKQVCATGAGDELNGEEICIQTQKFDGIVCDCPSTDELVPDPSICDRKLGIVFTDLDDEENCHDFCKAEDKKAYGCRIRVELESVPVCACFGDLEEAEEQEPDEDGKDELIGDDQGSQNKSRLNKPRKSQNSTDKNKGKNKRKKGKKKRKKKKKKPVIEADERPKNDTSTTETSNSETTTSKTTAKATTKTVEKTTVAPKPPGSTAGPGNQTSYPAKPTLKRLKTFNPFIQLLVADVQKLSKSYSLILQGFTDLATAIKNDNGVVSDKAHRVPDDAKN